MKKNTLIIFLIAIANVKAKAQQFRITSDELMETASSQRRDLSIPGSRIVLNAYDFAVDPDKITPLQYTYGKSVPLQIAYLTTHNEYSDQQRMGRVIKNLMSINKSEKGKLTEADTVLHTWAPHANTFRAVYNDGTVVNGVDFFHDENTIVRTVKNNSKTAYTISGLSRETVQTNKHNKTISISTLNTNYLIFFSNHWKNIKYYKTESDCLEQKNALSKPVKNGWWSVSFDPFAEMNIVTVFADKQEPINIDSKNIGSLFTNQYITESLSNRKQYWNSFLNEKIPHPENFSFSVIDPKGVSSQEVRLAYYKAWVCLAQNVLPPDPKVYPYYQLVTGKASLWDEGEEYAPFSATWESLVAIQLYALVEPEVSWSALKGLLSLVDDTGMLGGESLPSRKAQAAWQLYAFTNDEKSLREVYPALKRYLNWRKEQPRWIYKSETPDNEKDAEFVVSAIADIQKMQQIAAALKMTDDFQWWKKQEKELFEDYLNWFWKAPDSIPVQHLNQFKGRDTYPVQITSGLLLKNLNGRHLNSMMNLFNNVYDTTKSFAGFEAPKYPDMDYTIYGLIFHQQSAKARVLVEANIRDVIRTGSFAETYFHRNGKPVPSGVRPSIFGMAQVIGFTLLKNGYVFDQGIPQVTGLFLENGGVSNIRYKNDIISLKLHGSNRWVDVLTNDEFLFKVPVDTIQIKPVFQEVNTTDFYLKQAGQSVFFDRALKNEGNYSRVLAFLKKALKGDSLTIGFIGGSITAGAAASDFNRSSYAALTYQWLQNQFPQASFKIVNAGIGATNSVYGVHRAEEDLLKHQPDLVFVEFSVNDMNFPETQETYEGLIRKILKSHRAPAVITLGLMNDKGENWQSVHLPVSKHYQLPYISYRDAFWPELESGNITWKALSPDEVHPNDRGHAYIAGLVIRYITEIYQLLKWNIHQQAVIQELPVPLTKNAYEFSAVLKSDRLQPDNHTRISGSNGWKLIQSGDVIEFTINAKTVWMNYWKTNKGDGGEAEVYLNNQKITTLSADFSGGWGEYIEPVMLTKSETLVKHAISIRFKGKPGQYFLINNFMVAGN